MINMMEPETQPAVEAVYRASIRAGAYPEVYYSSDFLKRIVLVEGTTDQVSWVPEVESYGMEWCDCYIGIRGAEPVRAGRAFDRPIDAAPSGYGEDFNPS